MHEQNKFNKEIETSTKQHEHQQTKTDKLKMEILDLKKNKWIDNSIESLKNPRDHAEPRISNVKNRILSSHRSKKNEKNADDSVGTFWAQLLPWTHQI